MANRSKPISLDQAVEMKILIQYALQKTKYFDQKDTDKQKMLKRVKYGHSQFSHITQKVNKMRNGIFPKGESGLPTQNMSSGLPMAVDRPMLSDEEIVCSVLNHITKHTLTTTNDFKTPSYYIDFILNKDRVRRMTGILDFYRNSEEMDDGKVQMITKVDATDDARDKYVIGLATKVIAESGVICRKVYVGSGTSSKTCVVGCLRFMQRNVTPNVPDDMHEILSGRPLQFGIWYQGSTAWAVINRPLQNLVIKSSDCILMEVDLINLKRFKLIKSTGIDCMDRIIMEAMPGAPFNAILNNTKQESMVIQSMAKNDKVFVRKNCIKLVPLSLTTLLSRSLSAVWRVSMKKEQE
eukprot:775798_1